MKSIFLLVILSIFITFSCRKKEEPRDSYYGNWMCQEYNLGGIGGYQQFAVSISRSLEGDSVICKITNFHQFGIDDISAVTFYENKSKELIIEYQTPTVNGSSVVIYKGKGIYSEDYSEIKWSYSIDVNGVETDFEATFY